VLFIISTVWLIFEPGFESLFTFVGCVSSLVASLYPDQKPQSGEPSADPANSGTHIHGSASSKTNRGQQVGVNYGTMMQNGVVRLSVGIFAAFILTIGILGASVIFNIGSLSPIAQDVWERFSPPFEAAQPGESLIIVANFADESAGQYAGIDPANYIFRELTDRIADDGLDIRVERLDETLDANTVRQTGEVYSATLVLWGQYDAVGITPYVERIKEVGTVRTDEEGQSVLVDPERIQFSVVTDLPAMSSYLVLFTLGADLGASGQWNESITYLTSAIAAIPEDELTAKPDEAYFLRGSIHDNMNNSEAAVRDYTQAISLEYEPLSWPYNNRGIIYVDQGDYARAITDYDRAIKVDPDYAKAYNNRGNAYRHQHAPARAIEDYNRSLELNNPEPALVHFNRGLAYADLGEYEQAIANYTRAIELNNPDPALVYTNRGIAYRNLGEYGHAIADYDRAIALNPEYAFVYYNRGIAYRNLGESRHAIADYDRAIELGLEDARAYTNRGNTYQDLNEYESAIADYDRAIELNNDILAYKNRGNAYFALGEYERAMEDYDRAIVLDPEYTDVYLARGILHQQLGNTGQAIADYERFLDLSNELNLRAFVEEQLTQLRGE
jgi:tetratricopeptide (TPR) repeat protein